MGVRARAELCRHVHIPVLVPIPILTPLPRLACSRGCPWHPSLGQQSFPGPSLQRDPVCPEQRLLGMLGLVPHGTAWGWRAQGHSGGEVLKPPGESGSCLGTPSAALTLTCPVLARCGGTRSGWWLPQGSGCQCQKLLFSPLQQISLNFLW